MSSPVAAGDRAMQSVSPILITACAQKEPATVPSHIRADGGIRTHDLPLTRRLLCQLSYVGKLVGEIPPKARAFEGP
jgi:hypothetical protein